MPAEYGGRGTILERVVVHVAGTATEHPPSVADPLERPTLDPRLTADAAADEERCRCLPVHVDGQRRKPLSPAQARRQTFRQSERDQKDALRLNVVGHADPSSAPAL
jgi:hypothetical protein